MTYIEKSQPAPKCLETKKNKTNGDYKCGNVLERIKNDFNNKCYICEYKEPETINIEHFRPHKGDIHLKFDGITFSGLAPTATTPSVALHASCHHSLHIP